MALYIVSIWFYVFLFLIVLVFITKRKTKVVLPPSPPKLPVIGNLHQLGALPHASLRHLSNKYGPVMLLHFGRLSTVIISSAEAAKMVLTKYDLNCCSRPSLVGLGKLSYNYRDVSFSPYGDYWRKLRKVCVVELFNVKRVQSYQFIWEEEVASLINSISHSSNTTVNLTENLVSLTTSIIVRIAFGKSCREIGLTGCDDSFQEMIREAVFVLGKFSASDCFPYVGWIVDRLTGLHGRFERVFGKLDGIFEQVFDDHINRFHSRQDEDHEDIIDVLLRVQRDGAEFGEALSKDSIKAVTMDLFLAGIDTGATVINWAMAELVRNPRIMKKAQDEIRTVAGKNGKVTVDEVEQLQYLKMVVRETFRLHPPAPLMLPRETMSHFRINGFDILPKTLIQINVWAIGRDPKYWKNAEEFFPERFSDSPIDFFGQHFELLPFGSGRRSCPGIYLATRVVELALANLLHYFDWKIPFGKDIDMEESVGQSLTLAMKTYLHLVPINPREQMK